jgi:hypothetical protein
MLGTADLTNRIGYMANRDSLQQLVNQQLASMTEDQKNVAAEASLAQMSPTERLNVLPPDVAAYWNQVDRFSRQQDAQHYVEEQQRAREEEQAARGQAGGYLSQGAAASFGLPELTPQLPGAQGQAQVQQASQPSLGMGDLRAMEQQMPGAAQPTTGRFAGMSYNELLAWQQAHAGELFDPSDPTGKSMTATGLEFFAALQAAQGLMGGAQGAGGGGGYGGGGADNSLGYAQLAEQQRQNEWARQFAQEQEKQRILEAQRNLQMTGANIQSGALSDAQRLRGELARVAIPAGMEWIPGFQPGGPVAKMAERSGSTFTPHRAVGTMIDTGQGPRMVADLIAKAQAAGG